MDRKFFILVLLLTIFSGLIFLARKDDNSRNIHADISKIPLTIGGWKGQNRLKDKNIFDILETENVIVREYARGGDKLTLSIVYYGGRIEGFHRPEACFTGQGSTIVYKGIENFTYNNNDIKLNKVIFQRGKINRILFYFFYSGGYISGSYKDFRIRLMLNRIMGKKHGAAMIQVSKDFNKNEKEVTGVLKEFILESMPSLRANLY